MNILWFLLVGVIAGWLAGVLVKGGGFGLIGDLVVGIIGALIGGLLFSGLAGAAGGGEFGCRDPDFVVADTQLIDPLMQRHTYGKPTGKGWSSQLI
jgi:uncharacterized membrane protein YeaQ/YmgE (transglycosylase-associated protein family)